MKRLVFAVVALGLLVASPASAQVPGYPNGCATCYINGFMDLPSATQVVTVNPGAQFGAAGWSYFCFDGQGADRYDAWWYDDQGFGHPIAPSAVHVYTFDRADVRAAFKAQCPAIDSARNNGFWVVVDSGQIPTGTHVVAVNLWHGPYLYTPSGPWQPSFLRTVVVQ